MIQVALPPYSIVYEVDEINEIGESYDNSEDNKQLIEAIKELNEHLSTLHEDLNPPEEQTSEEVTEETTEEVTEEPVEKEPTDLEKKVDSIDKTISEINEREKTKEAEEKEAEEKRAQEELNNQKSASNNLWTGEVYLSNHALGGAGSNYQPTAVNSFNIYKENLNPSSNYVLTFTYDDSFSVGIRLCFYDNNDVFLATKTLRVSESSNIEYNLRFSTPSDTSYVLFSLPKRISNISLYSDSVGRNNIIYFDDTVDTHLYLTSEVENASLNDVFTIGLSIRNLLLVFFMFWLMLKILGLLRAAIERVMNR